ncbi:MAG: hydantoinase/oxoprolinase family protein [Burkholderiaceae bacterium]|nr:hydantoinase/oxoprolinase family protein [Burkholderiaceae bacterium]
MSAATIDRRLILGIDIGGTYTDVISLDPRTGEVAVVKTPTTLPNRADGLINGIRRITDDPNAIATIIHGTTMATNAVLERKTGVVGLITTAGFRDVLEMRRRQRPQTYGMYGSFSPLVPRHMRVEVRERVSASGEVQTDVDESELTAAIGQLRSGGAEALAICFINSYANPINEIRAARIVQRLWPDAFVCSSSSVLPEIKEFERTSTTVLNAAVQPVIDRYLGDVEKKLHANGCNAQLSIVQSNGGIASVAATREKPATTILSGPAAGVTGGNYIAARAGFKDIVTFDMGGTSLDAAVVLDGEPCLTSETTIDFGVVLKIPMIQMTTVGAGGGSIASIDRGGFLQIGPESAGADPGPVAYGRGGNRPTVTDANIVMGRINVDRPIGGAVARFDLEAAERALLENIGKPLGLSTHAAAEAVTTVANTRMAGTVRLATVEKGHDPRKFTLVAFGGAGPLHAGAVMREAGIARTLVPYFPGLTSAIGCAVGNVQYDFVQTFHRRLDDGNGEALFGIWDEQSRTGRKVLEAGNHFITEIRTVYSADMQFVGQTHALLVKFQGRPQSMAEIRATFTERYMNNFGIALDLPISITNVRTSIIGVRNQFDFSGLRELVGRSDKDALLGHRNVWFAGRFVDTAIYERSRLPPDSAIRGPAIVEQTDTTVVIEPGLVAHVDDDLNLILQNGA